MTESGMTRAPYPGRPPNKTKASDIKSLVTSIAALALLGLVTGVIGGAAAEGFVRGAEWLANFFGVTPALAPTGSALQAAAVLVAGALLVGALQRGFPSRPLGPADAVEAAHVHDGQIGPVRAARATLSSFVALACGASVGQYGPLVYFGAAIGSILSRLRVGKSDLASIGVGCGVAAAIAAAFGAPIAGLVFAHEIVLRHYSMRAFAPITVAAVTGHLFGRDLFDAATLEALQRIVELPPITYLALVMLGILSAVAAKVFMHSVELATRLARASRIPPWLQPLCAAVGVWLAWQLVPDVLGIGLGLLRESVLGDLSMLQTLGLLVAKTLLTALCLGFGFAGGIVGPSLVLGSLLGSLYAMLIGWLVPSLGLPQVFAVGSMAAVTGAVIGAPLTTILIVFELTHNYELTIAVMVTVVFANLVSYRLYGRSYFDVQLRSRGVDFSLGLEPVRLQGRLVIGYVSNEPLRLSPGTPVASARTLLEDQRLQEAHLVDTEGRYVGVIRLGDLPPPTDSGEPETETVRGYAMTDHMTLPDTTSVWEAMMLLEDFVGESVPVVGLHGEYRGALFESSVIRAYLDAQDALRRESHAIG